MSGTTPDALRDEIRQAEEARAAASKRLGELRRQLPAETFEDHGLKDADGEPTRLSGLFGDRAELVLIHNMGSGCPYCTLWADGFNGIVPHLEDRAAFVVVSPDAPDVQRRFAESRGWRFRMASAEGSAFTRAAGFETEDGHMLPGVSTFRKLEDGTIQRVGSASFGPGDPFCGLWHLIDLLPASEQAWSPKLRYDD